MDLDTLRRQWQQQSGAATPPSLDSQTLHAMFLQKTQSPISQLTVNLRRDTRMMLIIAGLNLLNFWRLNATFHGSPLARYGLLALLGGVIGLLLGNVVLRRLILRPLTTAGADLRTHLRRASGQLRRLLRASRLTALTLGVLVMLLLLARQWDQLAAWVSSPAADHPARLATLILAVLGFGALLLLAYRFGQRRSQHRYGRYLDQLEGALRELEEQP